MFTLMFYVSDHSRKEAIESHLNQLHPEAHKLFENCWVLSNAAHQKFHEITPLLHVDDQFIITGQPLGANFPHKLNQVATEWIQHSVGKEMFPSNS
jgi:hypothetical protein